MVFCFQNYSNLLWEKNVLVIEKNFWNSSLKAENLQGSKLKLILNCPIAMHCKLFYLVIQMSFKGTSINDVRM